MHACNTEQWHGKTRRTGQLFRRDVGLTSLIPHGLAGEQRQGGGNPLSQKVVGVKK